MPISPIHLQRRHAELGRIRLGAKGAKGQPQKLDRFRFTSPSKSYIDDIAALYGGTAQPWDNNGKAEHEVFTDTATIPVIAVKGGLSQWLETWTGGGCIHRCDGAANVLTGEPCDPNDRAHQQAKPTTRLSVMLPELDAIGVWRLESHGWNAAAEIPAVAELAQYVGDLVPAVLHLVERRTVKDGRTSRFVVPVLDLRIGASRLREIAAEKSGMAEISGAAAPAQIGRSPRAIEAPGFAELPEVNDLDELTAMWRATTDPERRKAIENRAEQVKRTQAAAAGGSSTLEEAVGGPAMTPPAAAPPSPAEDASHAGPSTPDEAGVVDAEIVPDGDPDAIWQQILKAAGERGMTLADAEDDFARQMGGLISADASAAELQLYLDKLNAAVPA